MGTFARNIDVPWKPYTPPADGVGGVPRESGGSAVSLELSRDSGQRLMYVINQNNAQVEIIDRARRKILSHGWSRRRALRWTIRPAARPGSGFQAIFMSRRIAARESKSSKL